MSAIARLPRWLKPANRIVKILHALGLRLGTIRVLTVPGRNSGKLRSTPVSPLTVGAARYIVAGLPDGDWAKNARAAERGLLRNRRSQEEVRLREITDAHLNTEVMRAFPTEVPHGVDFFVQLGLVDGPEPESFAGASAQVAVFELSRVT